MKCVFINIPTGFVEEENLSNCVKTLLKCQARSFDFIEDFFLNNKKSRSKSFVDFLGRNFISQIVQ